MYAKNNELFATVASTHAAHFANAAIYVRVDCASVARLDAEFVLRSLEYNSGEFMPKHSRIDVCGMTAGEGMEVRSADADSLYSKERFTFSGERWRNLSPGKNTWPSQYDLLHPRSHWLNL
jgi:hypothetical protein